MSRIYQSSKPATAPSTNSTSNISIVNNTSTNNSNTNNNNITVTNKPTTAFPQVKLYHTEQHNSSPSSPTPQIQQQQHQQTMSSSHDIEKVVTRLETVASRLEKLASSGGVAHTNGVSNGGSSASQDDVNTPSVNAYVDILNGSLKQFLDYSSQIGSDVKTIGDMVKNLFNLEKALLAESTRSAQPSSDVFGKALQPLSKQIEEIQTFREKNRKSELFNHLSSISESVGALGWVTVTPAPCPYIKEMCDAGQFYTNRVLKDYKEKDPSKLHSNWVQTWIKVLNELQAYVKQYHTTGVSWNPRGGALDPSRISGSGAAAAAPAAAPKAGGGPPPPPPMPTYDLFADDQNKSSAPSGGHDLHAKLAKELNVGTDITKGLKKVSDDQKTHKNPTLRAGSAVPGGVSQTTSGGQTNKPGPVANKPPKFELVDKKWLIEYQNGNHNLVLDDVEIKQTIYVYHCKDCTVQVKGKVNSIILDSCDRVGVLFTDVLATIEFVNSRNVQAQVTGKVPTVSIDKTDGCQVYLSKQSLDVEIVSSKSSAMNILVPNAQGDDYTEQPLPEQYKTTIKNNKLVTVPTESV